MNWQNIDHPKILAEIQEQPLVLVFKHSTRCSISSATLDRLQRKWDTQEMQAVQTYFLDLICHREISKQIAETFGVEHQSPQVLLLKKGTCIYHNSHYGIKYDEIRAVISQS